MKTKFATVSSALSLVTLGFAATAHCSDAATIDPQDAASDTASSETAADAAGDANVQDVAIDTAPARKKEVEPNDGKAGLNETDSLTVPGEVEGVVDPANDMDIFKVGVAPGELWEWTVTPSSASLAPHLVVFDTTPGTLNPTVAAGTATSEPLVVQQFVLRGGTFVAGVRDARNVPASKSQNVGGAAYTYVLGAKKLALSPTAATFPSVVSGKLARVADVAIYSFSAPTMFAFDILVKAKRKAVPSVLDSRLSIYNRTTNTAVLTNDDSAGSIDSELGGTLPAGDYYLVLENEADLKFGGTVPDLSYELEFKLR